MNVIMPNSPMRIDFVYFALSYIWSCIFFLGSKLYFFCFGITRIEEEESVGSTNDGGVGNLKWPRADKKRIIYCRFLNWTRCAFGTQNGWSVWTQDWILFPCLLFYLRHMLHHQNKSYRKFRRGFRGRLSLQSGLLDSNQYLKWFINKQQ